MKTRFAIDGALAALISSSSVQATVPVPVRIAHFIPAHLPISKGLFTELTQGLVRESNGKLSATHHPSGELEPSPARYLARLQKGDIDIALLVPAYTRDVFPDYELFLLPNLFDGVRTASQAHQRLAKGASLRGYDKVHVLAAFTTGAYQLHMRDSYTGFASLRDKRIRVSQGVQEQIVSALGAQPVLGRSVVDIAKQLGAGRVDATLLAWAPANAFNVLEQTRHHVQVNLG